MAILEALLTGSKSLQNSSRKQGFNNIRTSTISQAYFLYRIHVNERALRRTKRQSRALRRIKASRAGALRKKLDDTRFYLKLIA